MTFEELNNQCVAIRAYSLIFDYFGRNVTMRLKPEYGYSDRVKGRIFTINFVDCIFISASNISKLAQGQATEFVSWGKSSLKEDSNSAGLYLFHEHISTTISSDMKSTIRRDDLKGNLAPEYEYYFFQNVFEDAVGIICSKVSVYEWH